MDFLLKNITFLEVLAIKISFVFISMISYLISKKIAKSKIDAINESSYTYFDIVVSMLSNIALSVFITFISCFIYMKCIDYFGLINKRQIRALNDVFICLAMFLSVVLTLNNFFVTASKLKKNLFQTTDDNIKLISRFFKRISVVIFIVSAIYSSIQSCFEIPYIKEREIIRGIIIYIFVEIRLSQNVFLLKLNASSSMNNHYFIKSIKFIESNFAYVYLFFMVLALRNSNIIYNDMFFQNIFNILKLFLLMIVFQSIIVFIANITIKKISSICKKTESKDVYKNIIWICNSAILFIYPVLLMMLLNINAKKILENHIFSVFVIIFLTVTAYKGFSAFKYVIMSKILNENIESDNKKMLTFMPVFSAMFYIFLFVTSLLVIFSKFEIDVMPVLATFSIFGATICLSAKDTIQAFLQGLTLLFEKNLFIGEMVKINDVVGVIEKLSIRVIYIRKRDGSLYIVPYNLVNTITNYSKTYTRHIDSLRIVSADDVSKACEMLSNTISEMKKEDKYKDKIIGDLNVRGIQPFELNGIRILWEVKTIPDISCLDIIYDIYSRLLKKFQEFGIKIPAIASGRAFVEMD